MKRIISMLYMLLPLLSAAQRDSLLSGRYAWKEPSAQKSGRNASTVLFEGKVHDMEWLQMTSNALSAASKSGSVVPGDEEHLLIIKSGNLRLVIKDSAYSIAGGSVAVLMPGERFSLQNNRKEPCEYYLMKYRSKLPVDVRRGEASGGSLVKNWEQIEFKPHDKGGRRDFFERPTAMCRRFEMHVTTLKPGIKSHEPHTHKAEEIVLVTEGDTEMQIGSNFYKGGAGSVYYLGSDVPHAIQNKGEKTCTYFAFQFE